VATIHFSGSLTQYTGGVQSLTVEARRVRDLMETVTERFPALAAPLEVMAVAVDGEIHQEAEFVELSEGSDVHFVPQIAGG
jgi:molybdopterin converting factor small subunit